MLSAVAGSRVPVRSQQKDEPDLTEREKLSILRALYREKPLVFLERFRGSLRAEHLACFRHLRGDYRADFYCAEVAEAGRARATRTRLRNKRYAALRQLIQGGEYFSDEEMRARDPLLYEQYIGQYLSEEDQAPSLQQSPPAAGGTLSSVLLQAYHEQLLRTRLHRQQEEEDACLEEEEEDDDDDEVEAEGPGEEAGDGWEPDAEEKGMLREEFTSRMYQRFLDGKDPDFDYSEVDDNPELDNLDIVSRDAEERYFDEEEPEEALDTGPDEE
ncbi:coiled-coil domain-containing protein 97 isoform X2 [Ornithorhynchus anatinus]|uniref:coiled-coil domain-containing protein 97 isoform X2 n=1 Tax=Ornithorhynchus anatinus TaxID=9258 RepID=UPI0010A83CD4|nr:coiled-coil domain-containing protein 97 isoform X2 [Ornithorhynchus anatinus]